MKYINKLAVGCLIALNAMMVSGSENTIEKKERKTDNSNQNPADGELKEEKTMTDKDIIKDSEKRKESETC